MMYQDVLVIEMQHHYYYIYKYEIYIYLSYVFCEDVNHSLTTHIVSVTSASQSLGSASKSVSDSPLSLFTNQQQHSLLDQLCTYIETMMMTGIGLLVLSY